MARAAGLPRPTSIVLSKTELLECLARIDADLDAQKRITGMEADFRERIRVHLDSLAGSSKSFRKFNTNPFVLLFYSAQKEIRQVREIEEAIVPAKIFSSMETSAGRMVEQVVLSHYGWACVESAMHTTDSVIDGKMVDNDVLRLVTLKSGPRCINDSMTDSISSEVFKYASVWAKAAGVNKVEFTVGVLYGTPRMSNKKDWHILRKIAQSVSSSKSKLIQSPNDGWQCRFQSDGVEITANVRIGKALWDSIGIHRDAYTEILVAAIRSCIEPTNRSQSQAAFEIQDLADICSIPEAFRGHIFTVLQPSQIEWLLLMSAHFSDSMVE